MSDLLFNALAPTVSGLGFTLLGIERGFAGERALVRLFIDHDEGIDVNDCELVSRQVSDLIDVEELLQGEFTLEVSSPGVDRPLFTLAQHKAFLGETVALRLRALMNGRRKITGVLTSVEDDSLEVECDGQQWLVPFREVEKSRLVPDWNGLMAAKRDRKAPSSDEQLNNE